MLPEIPVSRSKQYRKFEIGEWYGWVSLDHVDDRFESKLQSMEALFSHDNVITWYKTKRNQLAEVKWPGMSDVKQSVVLKSYQSRSIYNTVRLKFGLPRAVRHWQNAWVLLEKKITTPLPVLLALRKDGGGQGLLAVETVVNHQMIRDIYPRGYQGDPELIVGGRSIRADKFAVICGQYVRQIHDKGIAHRDMSGGNILVPQLWNGTSDNLSGQFVMLDINRIRQIKKEDFNIKFRIQDLERLNIPEQYLENYYFGYAGDDLNLQNQWPKFLKYRKGYRRIKETRNPLLRGALKIFTYWPRTG